MPLASHAVKAYFAGFELDLRSSELVRDGRRVRLQGQPFQVLCLLLERAGEVVLREQLRQRLWPGETFVDFDHGLNKAIAKLRDALDQPNAADSMIQTLPRRGYRFVPAVEWAPPPEPSDAAAKNGASAHQPGEIASAPFVADPAPAGQDDAARASSSASRRSSRVLAGWLILAASVLLAAGIALRRHSPVRPVIHSVAVLPLQNLSNNPDEEYFADGMTDELITDLSHIRSLRVISHASANALGDSRLSVPEVADRLHVDAVVEGTILRSGNRVRITVQLVAAHPEQHLWAASYERSLGDAVTLQNEIAAAAVAQIRTEVTAAEHAQLRAETPVNPEAYDECLRARYLLEQETPEQLVKVTPHLERAIQLAPQYADPYALLGKAWVFIGIDQIERMRPAAQKAVAYAQTAIRLDPNSAEGYEALGAALTLLRQWKESEAALRHSLEINPNNPRAVETLAILLDMLHRGDEAVSVMRESAAANPVSIRSQRMYANVLYRARYFDQAIAQSHRVLELDPNRELAYFILGNALGATGRYAEAEEAFRHYRYAPDIAAWLAALRGDKREARRLLAEKQPASTVYVPVARYLLGDQQAALAEIDRLTNQEWEIQTYFLNCEAVYDPMRNDPRFIAILRRSGLPQ